MQVRLTRGARGAGFAFAASVVFLSGCGGSGSVGSSSSLSSGSGTLTGGGSTSTGSTSSSRAALNVYVTDGFSEQYKQVLVTLYKIEVTGDGTNYATVFSDDAGRTLDLSSLADTAELIASLNVAAGSYTKARVTFGNTFTLVGKDGTSTATQVDSGVGTQSGNQVTLTVNTKSKVKAGQDNVLLIDFKLAEFQLIGGKLRPQIVGGDASDCKNKKRTGHIAGAVSGVSSTGFTLTTAGGKTLTVTLSDTTTITSGQTGDAVTLAEGQQVSVEGTPNTGTNTLAATSVTLLDYTTVKREEVRGTVASVDTTAGSFVLTVTRASGIQPTGGTITVATDANTRFAKGRKGIGSLSDVTVGASVRAEGTFDTTTQTLTARAVGFAPTGQTGTGDDTVGPHGGEHEKGG